jgi:tRNA-specific 2-thiouridylase
MKWPYTLSMDQKKQLNAYLPEKGSRGEKIVVGLSGGIDAYVAAYLLKIQKYDLIGVTVLTGWDQFQGDQSGILSCQVNDVKLTQIRDFCHNLNIPHFTVSATEEFSDDVVEEWVASRITGSISHACWNCHDLRMKLLSLKTKQLGVSALATGHYAKVLHGDETEMAVVSSSNDEVHDQSSLLARLPQPILRTLNLPLSDLQKKEVLKLAENFGLDATLKKLHMFECFPWTDLTMKALRQRVPKRVLQGGIVFKREEELGEHEGIINYEYGSLVRQRDSHNPEGAFLSRYSMPQRRMFVENEEFFHRETILLTHCLAPDERLLIEPLKGAIKFADGSFKECWVYPKALGAVSVEWEGTQKLSEGEVLSVYKKKGKNSRVLLSGTVNFLPMQAKRKEGDAHAHADHDTNS